LLLVALICSSTPLYSQPESATSTPKAEEPARATRQKPFSGWDGFCPELSVVTEAFVWGAVIGMLLAAIPAGILVLVGERWVARGLLLVAGVGVGAFFVSVRAAFANCTLPVSSAEIDAKVDTDSLYRSWMRFSTEADASRRRELARIIHCETTRLMEIPNTGEPAVRLTQSRIAPRERFEKLEEAANAAYTPPSLISSYACDTPAGVVRGRVLDAESGQPLSEESMTLLSISSARYLRELRPDGTFEFEVVPSSTDSVTLHVCPSGYRAATQRMLVADGSVQSIDVTVRRTTDYSAFDVFAICKAAASRR
jgi:hypothetical protein